MSMQPDRDRGRTEPDGARGQAQFGREARSAVTAGFAKGVVGFAVAAGGAIVVLLAFFALPFASLFFISVTGAQVAGSGVGGSALLWLVPLAAVGAIVVSGRALWDKSLRSRGRKSSAAAVLGLGGASTVLLLIGYSSAGAYARLAGMGFWLGLFGSLAVVGGALAAWQRCKT